MALEILCEGLERTWLDEGAIAVYTVTQIGSKTLVSWRDSILETLKKCQADRPYLALHDLSAKGISMGFLAASGREILNVGITRFGQEEVEALLAQRPELKIYVAVVVSSQTSGQITARLAMPNVHAGNDQIVTKAFFEQTAALNWLRTHISKPLPIAPYSK
jgi:hypothetical protein